MSPEELLVTIKSYLPKFVGALPVVAGIILGAFILNLAIGRLLSLLAHRTSLTDLDVLPFRKVFRWVVRLLAVVLILGVFGFELGGLWAMVSTVLGLIAIGFVAVWSLLSNVSSTLLILFMRPFQIGDDVALAGDPVSGRVIDLNFFFTTLLAHDGRTFQIPNNLFFQKILHRKRNVPGVSLSTQLNNSVPFELPPPPAPPGTASEATATSSQPTPWMNTPDPRSMNIPGAKP
ncbi:MAG TPA: mechanosensitive ion channel family protein [Opitutaceae bacterium]|nr:mechanosensitive ion channel family protein [Opitutaceae bacterium]